MTNAVCVPASNSVFPFNLTGQIRWGSPACMPGCAHSPQVYAGSLLLLSSCLCLLLAVYSQACFSIEVYGC